MKIRAVSYLRMSTQDQILGHSLERQLKLSQDYAKEKGFILTDDLRDIGLSAHDGTHRKKGQWGDFYNAAINGALGTACVLLVESLDRLSRENPTRAYTQFLSLIQAGIEIHTLADRQIYDLKSIESNPGLMFTSLGVMMRAHNESDEKSRRIRSVNTSKRAKILHSPMGFRCPNWIEEADGAYQLIPDRADIIRKIFSLYLDEGLGTFAITRFLNENIESYPRFSLPQKKNRGKRTEAGWQKSYVTKILNNPAVHGEYRACEVKDKKRVATNAVNALYYPPAIPREDFLRAQATLKSKGSKSAGRKGRQYRNIFTNLLVCSQCQSSVVFVDKGQGPKGGIYLHCSNSQKHFQCNAAPWKYDDFVSAFFSFCAEIDLETIINSPESLIKRKKLEATQYDLQNKILTAQEDFERRYHLKKSLTPAAEKLAIKSLNKLAAEISEMGKEEERIIHELRVLDGAALPNIKQDIQDTLAKALATEDGEQAMSSRRKINGYLHSLIDKIVLTTLPSKIAALDAADEVTLPMARLLEKEGIKQGDEVQYAEFYDKDPERFRKLHKNFVINFKNGLMRTVHPELRSSWKLIGFGESSRKLGKI